MHHQQILLNRFTDWKCLLFRCVLLSSAWFMQRMSNQLMTHQELQVRDPG